MPERTPSQILLPLQSGEHQATGRGIRGKRFVYIMFTSVLKLVQKMCDIDCIISISGLLSERREMPVGEQSSAMGVYAGRDRDDPWGGHSWLWAQGEEGARDLRWENYAQFELRDSNFVRPPCGRQQPRGGFERNLSTGSF